ncbi:MAG: hypothetical protein K2M98_07175, partial [Muribaculum sp.]|nr:hypothetical protein [Muribaculum sp.]
MKYRNLSINNAGFILALFVCMTSAFSLFGEDVEWKYRRNSIYNIMILHPEYKFGDELEAMFNNLPVPARFNDHSLGVNSIKFANSDRKDQRGNIENFITKSGLAQKMISKWFGRNKVTGAFNIELIKDRACYDADDTDVAIAMSQARGIAALYDAGEELIPNTYVVFNDVMYNSRSGVGSMLKMFGNVYIGNADGIQSSMQEIAGFKVTVKSYLYRLVWTEEIANTFYESYYYEGDNTDNAKKLAYEHDKNLFRLEYVGESTSSAQNTSFVGVKDPIEAIRKICVRVIDRNLSDLQHSFPDFRIKAPLLTSQPLVADVGMKEGITEKSTFEVLQPEIDSNGKLRYNRVGVI